MYQIILKLVHGFPFWACILLFLCFLLYTAVSPSAFIYLNAPVSGCVVGLRFADRGEDHTNIPCFSRPCACVHTFFLPFLGTPSWLSLTSRFSIHSKTRCKLLFGWIKCSGKCNNVSYVHGIYNRFGGDLVQKWKHSFNDGAMLWRLTQTGLTHTRHPMNPHEVTIQGKIIKDRKILYLWGQMHDTVNMDLLQSFGWPWLGAALLFTCLFNSDCIKKRLTSCGIGDQWKQWCKWAFRSGASQV